MGKIPIGNFGNIIAPPPQRANIPASAFDAGGKGLQKTGEVVMGFAEDLMRKEAASDAAAAIIGGKRKLDEWVSAQESSPFDDAGKPRFETAAKDFDKVFEGIRSGAIGGTGNNIAREAIRTDLTKYHEQLRGKVLDTARKQKQDYSMSILTGELEALRAVPGLDEVERSKRLGQVIGSMVVSGGMRMEDGVKLRMKEDALFEYGKAYESIQQANTREQLYEVRGQISAFNPKLSPEQNKGLVELANSRIRAIEDEAEITLKSRQADLSKDLDAKARAGTLTLEEVELHRATLPPDTYRRFLAMPDINRGPVGSSAESFVRDIERETLKGYRDPRRLESLRNRITDLMTGYDPVTKTYGERKLSAEEGRRMLDNVEGYLRDIRTEGRQQRSETDSRQRADLREAADLLKRMYDARGEHERVPSARTGIETRYLKAYEDLLKHKDDPLGWLDQHKKANPDIVTPPVRVPSWAVTSGGKLDLEASRRRLLDDKQAGRISDQEYRRRFDQLNGMKP